MIKSKPNKKDLEFLEYFEFNAVLDLDIVKLDYLIDILRSVRTQKRLEEWEKDHD